MLAIRASSPPRSCWASAGRWSSAGSRPT